MDFVVSKVAMAICALMVTAVLAGLFAEGNLLGGSRGFERILDEFCELTERAAVSGSESEILWEVPFLPSGEAATFSIYKGTVLVETNEGAAAERPSCGLHIWRPDGRALNESAVVALDEGAGSLEFDSGQTVEIVTRSIVYENEPRAFVFVYLITSAS